MVRISILVAAVIVLAISHSSCKSHKITTDTNTDSSNTEGSLQYVKKGNIQLDLKNYKEALDLLDKAIAMDSENGEAFAYRGMAKYNLKDYKGAIADYDEAIRLIPDYGEVYDLRGIAKADQGDKVGACEDWNQAYNLGFNNAFKLLEKFCIEDGN